MMAHYITLGSKRVSGFVQRIVFRALYKFS